MKFHLYLIIMIFSFFLYCCGSGEYDIDEINNESVDKKLMYDTLNTSDNSDDLNIPKVRRDSYRFIIQIGAFFMEENFKRFYDEAKAKLGNEVSYVQQNNLYKIRIGGFNTRPEAMMYLENLRNQGYNDAFVITIKKQN